jgi:DNA repair and recombination protein RAD54B
VPANQRSQIVKSFNASGKILLLSTKAGGTGLNLIGANRLVLVDSDWNPANDLQATARVWRDGQSKPVSIYRLLSTGTMEERLFQRQELKGALARTLGFKSTSNASGGGASGGGAFTQGELRDLFSYVKETRCDTADRIQAREGANTPEHWLNDASKTTNDALLARAIADGGADVSFVCQLPATTASAIEPLADDEPDAKE